MRNRFDRQLEQLHVELMEMGSMCEEVIRKTSRVLETGEKEMARDIRKEDARIDEQERLIESLCLKLLLQQQPVAKDLRKVSAALKMITDMERIGDQASDIAEIVETGKLVASQQQTKLAQMAETTINMVTGSVDAYVKQDLELVKEVIAMDDKVDELFLEVRDEIASAIGGILKYLQNSLLFLLSRTIISYLQHKNLDIFLFLMLVFSYSICLFVLIF